MHIILSCGVVHVDYHNFLLKKSHKIYKIIRIFFIWFISKNLNKISYFYIPRFCLKNFFFEGHILHDKPHPYFSFIYIHIYIKSVIQSQVLGKYVNKLRQQLSTHRCIPPFHKSV